MASQDSTRQWITSGLAWLARLGWLGLGFGWLFLGFGVISDGFLPDFGFGLIWLDSGFV